MDLADSDPLRKAIRAQGHRIAQQDDQINILHHHMRELMERQESAMTSMGNQLNSLVQMIQMVVLPSSSTESEVALLPGVATGTLSMAATPTLFPQLSQTEHFSGDSRDRRAFLNQCELHFELQAAAFPSNHEKIAFIISHLTGRAEGCATAEWSRKSEICSSLTTFTQTFVQVFQHTTPGREAARALVKLRQGRRRVTDYATEFRTLAAESDWNPAALFDAFWKGSQRLNRII